MWHARVSSLDRVSRTAASCGDCYLPSPGRASSSWGGREFQAAIMALDCRPTESSECGSGKGPLAVVWPPHGSLVAWDPTLGYWKDWADFTATAGVLAGWNFVGSCAAAGTEAREQPRKALGSWPQPCKSWPCDSKARQVPEPER